jgi:hypothetical protein
MKRLLIGATGLALMASSVPLATGAPRTTHTISIGAVPNPVLFKRRTLVSGKLAGSGVGGIQVTLRENPYPFRGARNVATTTTAADGAYSFSRLPGVNIRYSVTARTRPRTNSAELLVVVRKRVSMSVSDTTPRRGQRVRFSGLVAPAHNGQVIYIERRTSTGSFRAVASTRLVDAGNGRSRYSRSFRIYRRGVYRAHVGADADHGNGIGPRRTLRVH